MDQPEELDSANVEAPGFPVRTAFRVFLVLYLVTLPACTKNAGHFGPGFFHSSRRFFWCLCVQQFRLAMLSANGWGSYSQTHAHENGGLRC